MDDQHGPTTTSAQRFVDARTEPAIAFDRHLDVVAANAIAGAVSASLTVGTNLARFTFLNPYVEDSVEGWESEAHRTAAALRDSLDQHDEDGRFRALLGELMARSNAFALEWAAGAGRAPTEGTTTVENPLVGRLVLRWEHVRRPEDLEHVLVVWSSADADTAERLEALRRAL
ncbi:hypothetical protein [Curtobacterium sp. PhB115]|uniref:MmyB family transcriptional regulator n=1 Tax=Curtobacterium sp. PhB115 TaxID=2485173 RepID=UPI000F4BA198|nr:hypothetical protein [Curtobacterium sp. PhB115]ROP74705.1 hypothetical protein EDF19_0791 [Curtobacterium sp. PhB115]